MSRTPTEPVSTETLSSPADERRVMRLLRESPAILEMISTETDSGLGLQARLRKLYPNDLVRAALSLHELRLKARSKFSRAAAMWFDRKGFEQSTSEAIARHKAMRFEGAVWDLCCGIGGDSLALAGRCDVTAVDLNTTTCLRAEWNAEAYGVAARLKTLDVDVTSVIEQIGATDLIHIDPDRRPGAGGRVSRVEDYEPGLPFLHGLMDHCRGGAIKVGPASNFGGKFEAVEIELISLDGECKEATIWFGALAGTAPFRATALPSGETIAGHPLEISVPLAPLGRFIYDPDPAVVRSGLVDLVAHRHGLKRLDGAEEYLTSDTLVDSAFVTPFEVLADLPNNERDYRNWLRKSDFGQIEIKCRHIPIQADAVRRRLPLPGDQPGVLIFARCDGKARAILGRRTPRG